MILNFEKYQGHTWDILAHYFRQLIKDIPEISFSRFIIFQNRRHIYSILKHCNVLMAVSFPRCRLLGIDCLLCVSLRCSLKGGTKILETCFFEWKEYIYIWCIQSAPILSLYWRKIYILRSEFRRKFFSH